MAEAAAAAATTTTTTTATTRRKRRGAPTNLDVAQINNGPEATTSFAYRRVSPRITSNVYSSSHPSRVHPSLLTPSLSAISEKFSGMTTAAASAASSGHHSKKSQPTTSTPADSRNKGRGSHNGNKRNSNSNGGNGSRSGGKGSRSKGRGGNSRNNRQRPNSSGNGRRRSNSNASANGSGPGSGWKGKNRRHSNSPPFNPQMAHGYNNPLMNWSLDGGEGGGGSGAGSPSCTLASLPILPPHMPRPWASGTMTVTQYNVLGDGFYACVGEYAASPFGGFNTYSKPEERTWANRFPRLLAEFDGLGSDALCLQEVQYDNYMSFFYPAMHARGYQCFLSRRQDDQRTTTSRDLYLALFIRCSHASVLEQPLIIRFHEVARQLWTSEGGRKAFFGDIAETIYADKARRERFEAFIAKLAEADNEAMVALCETRAVPSKKFVVVNSHLFWNPAYADLKALQMALLCYALRVHLQRWNLLVDDGGKCPIVVCTDMNSQPRDSIIHGGAEGAYVLATTGTLAVDHADHPATDKPTIEGVEGSIPRTSSGPDMVALSTAGISLRSVYGSDPTDQRNTSKAELEPQCTTKTAKFTGCIDYIFAGGGFDIVDFCTLPYNNTKEGVHEFKPMPNPYFPSDHLPLSARLRLR